jgi:hypothetical protein
VIAQAYSGVPLSVWQDRTRKGSPGLSLALIPPSLRGRGGIDETFSSVDASKEINAPTIRIISRRGGEGR